MCIGKEQRSGHIYITPTQQLTTHSTHLTPPYMGGRRASPWNWELEIGLSNHQLWCPQETRENPARTRNGPRPFYSFPVSSALLQTRNLNPSLGFRIWGSAIRTKPASDLVLDIKRGTSEYKSANQYRVAIRHESYFTANLF